MQVCTVLIIEDSPADRRLLQEYLSSQQTCNTIQFRWQLAPNLTQALAVAEWADIDVVLLDLHFPGQSADDTLAVMKEYLAPRLPVVVMTGLNDQQTALQAIRYGAQDYLIKDDIQPDVLARAIRHACERFRLTSELEQARLRQWQLANYDALTELPNRRLLGEHLARTIQRHQRNGKPAALLYIDIDGFKSVNDSLGHAAGDRLLVGIAERLRQTLRESDIAARLGGDEFAFIASELQCPEDAALIAQKLINNLSRVFYLEPQHDVRVGASIGIALFPGDTAEAAELLRYADLAMYAAKQAGGCDYRFYSRSLADSADKRLRMVNALYNAIASDQLRLDYRPLIELASGKTVAQEAMPGWQHPTLGYLRPGAFTPLLKESALLLELDSWVLNAVCRLWGDDGCAETANAGATPQRVALGISARYLAMPRMVDQVQHTLDANGFSPERLILEISDSNQFNQLGRAMPNLEALRRLGIHIAIADFGGGDASLNELRQLPVDMLKLDRSLLPTHGIDNKTAAVRDAVVQLATRLGLIIVGTATQAAEAGIGQPCQSLNPLSTRNSESRQSTSRPADFPQQRTPNLNQIAALWPRRS